MTHNEDLEEAKAILTAGVPKVFAAMCKTAVDVSATRRTRLKAIVILLEGAERGFWKPEAIAAALGNNGVLKND